MTNQQNQPSCATCRGQNRSRRAVIQPVAMGLLIVVAVAIAAWAALRMDPWGEDGGGLSERFEFNADAYLRADPALIAFQEMGSFPTGLSAVRGLAAGPDGRIYVAGEDRVRVFAADGKQLAELPVKGEPTCLAAGGAEHVHPGRLYVGAGRRVLLFDPQGTALGAWTEGLDDATVLTSLAIGDEHVLAADAGNRVVLQFDADGDLTRRIGEPDEARGVRGFVIPSAHFDVAVTADGLLRVANPGARRIETFTAEGDLLGQWGKSSPEIDGFFGCCNPADFAVTPDGRFVTAEKGIPRIKIYSPKGELECVVADPAMLGQVGSAAPLDGDSGQAPAFDVAVDNRGRVLALDPLTRQVRVFVRKDVQTATAKESEQDEDRS
ncbi:MAG: hypothetical protein GX575_26055 [Candidatus Anammoximicrobium sp.]|nr:hypothetical protein [Candidatus Anammoximicrobium sp.]